MILTLDDSCSCHIDLTPVVGFAVFVHSVVGIELTLYWNGISDVYTISSIGQLIPFIIAVVELARFIFQLIKKVKPTTICFYK